MKDHSAESSHAAAPDTGAIPDLLDLDIDAVRARFPSLAREVAGQPAAYLDGPAGSQVPDRVITAMTEYLTRSNANTHGLFA
ncbi:MAG: aminotransferase class V-fold PLP-dependent enzyme, partial [Myxococcota bacterium]